MSKINVVTQHESVHELPDVLLLLVGGEGGGGGELGADVGELFGDALGFIFFGFGVAEVGDEVLETAGWARSVVGGEGVGVSEGWTRDGRETAGKGDVGGVDGSES